MGIYAIRSGQPISPEIEEDPCEMCSQPVDGCICPECPVCGAAGDPVCYQEHDLVESEEQIRSRQMVEAWESQQLDRELDELFNHCTLLKIPDSVL